MDVEFVVVDNLVAENKESACLFAHFQDGVMLQIIEDSFVDLL